MRELLTNLVQYLYCLSSTALVQHYQEFFTTVATNNVDSAESLPEQISECPNHVVTNTMTV